MAAGNDIDSNAVNRALAAQGSRAGTRFGGYVQHFPVVSSTSDLALQAAREGTQRGVWVADEQTAGRGRGGHTWLSRPGDGLYVSAVVTLALPAQDALRVSLATGLAAQTAIEENCGLQIDLRWPNDLMLHGRKCGGILVETAIEPSIAGVTPMLRYAVIGIGINVNHETFPEELAALATSLRMETGVPILRQPLLVSLLRALDREIELLEMDGPGATRGGDILGRFTEASSWARGKRVSVPEQGGYTGVTAGLDTHGYLLVDSDDGVRRTVRSGGVRELETA